MRISTAFALSLLLGGCASTAYKDEATQLGASATALAAAFPSQPSVDAEGGAVIDFNMDMLMQGGPLRYTSDCGDKAFAAYEAFVGSLPRGQADQDAAYAVLVKSPACEITEPRAILAPASAPATSTAADGGQASPATKPSAAQAAHLKRDEARQEAKSTMAHPSSRAQAKPVCKGACSLEDYTSQIKAYGVAIQAAASAQSVTDAQTALGKADTALDSLLKAAKAPPLAAPVVDAIEAIGKLALQQAQYAAMKRAVLTFDSYWPLVAPAVESAARFRQAQLIQYRADASASACMAAQLYLNDDHYFANPGERLQLFGTLESKVDAASASLKAAEIDPGAAIAAFTKANHTLALAMEDPRRHSTTLTADINAVNAQITTIQKAATPATST
ncbi:MAG: hypothetical protein ACREEB_06740 [Caulobacteraceae bacterium]